MLDPHGFVATCNSTHFFIVVDADDAPRCGPPTGASASAGITRANVLEICRADGIPARETTFSLTDVYSAPRGVRHRHLRRRRAGAHGRRPHDRHRRARAGGRAAAGAVRRAASPPTSPDASRHDRSRVAMWSGPRNISTAMMRAWENRPDTVVVDEPFYAAYLARTGLDHPGRDEVHRLPADRPGRRWSRACARRCRPARRALRQAHDPPPARPTTDLRLDRATSATCC